MGKFKKETIKGINPKRIAKTKIGEKVYFIDKENRILAETTIKKIRREFYSKKVKGAIFKPTISGWAHSVVVERNGEWFFIGQQEVSSLGWICLDNEIHLYLDETL